MTDATRHTFKVRTAYGEEIEVVATRVDLTENSSTLTFFDGDTLVGSFRGYNSFYAVTDEPAAE